MGLRGPVAAADAFSRGFDPQLDDPEQQALNFLPGSPSLGCTKLTAGRLSASALENGCACSALGLGDPRTRDPIQRFFARYRTLGLSQDATKAQVRPEIQKARPATCSPERSQKLRRGYERNTPQTRWIRSYKKTRSSTQLHFLSVLRLHALKAALQRVEAANLWIMTKLLSEHGAWISIQVLAVSVSLPMLPGRKRHCVPSRQRIVCGSSETLREGRATKEPSLSTSYVQVPSRCRLFHKYVAGYVPPGVRQMIEPPTTKHFRWHAPRLLVMSHDPCPEVGSPEQPSPVLSPWLQKS